MSRMLAALKKLEETGQFAAPPENAAPPARASEPAGQGEAAAGSKAVEVLAPPAPVGEVAEEFSGDPAEDYGRDLQCIEEQLAWAEALRAELLREEAKEAQAEEAARVAEEEEVRRESEERARLEAEATAQREAAERARQEEAERPRRAAEEQARQQAEAEAARLAEEAAAALEEEEEDDEPTVLETPADAARAEAEPHWVTQPHEPTPRREGPLKIPFGTPHAPLAQPVETRPSPAAPPPSEPEEDTAQVEPVVCELPVVEKPQPAQASAPAAPVEIEPPAKVETPTQVEPAPVVEETPAPVVELSFGPPLEKAEQAALLTPAVGEEDQQLGATCDRLLALLAERDARVCLLSSVGPGEEAARLTMQLAMRAVERVEKRVLVVEGDWQRRRVSRATVDLPSEFGGVRGPEEACVLADISPRLMLLPAGESETGSAYRERVLAHLRRYAERYSLVLVEGGGENNPQIPVISADCEAAVLAVPLAQAEVARTRAALGKLHSWGVTVVGSIVTGASAAEAAQWLEAKPAA